MYEVLSSARERLDRFGLAQPNWSESAFELLDGLKTMVQVSALCLRRLDSSERHLWAPKSPNSTFIRICYASSTLYGIHNAKTAFTWS